MGGRETGSLSNLLPGHRDAANAAHRDEVANYWGVETLPDKPGLSAIELFEAVRSGRIKALWIACTNPAQSMPDQTLVRQALQACPFVVVQEAFANTETCAFADLLLPAASWGEKEGTVTNSERRISHVRPAIPAPGQARPDWAIVCDLARRLETTMRPGQPSRFAFDSPAQLFDEYKSLTAERDLDYSRLSHALIDELGPQQWPFDAQSRSGTARLYADHRFATADGRARFIAEAYAPVREQRDAAFPLTLNTGRLRDHWHGMSRTGTAAQLFGHVQQAQVSLHPRDMQERSLSEGQLVAVNSRRGRLVLPVSTDPQLARGQAFIPMHWGDRFLKGLGVNVLTQPAFDPLSRQPELKQSAIEVTPVDLPWELFVLIEGNVQQRFDALRAVCEPLEFASFALTGRDRPALVVRAAHRHAPQADTLAHIDRLAGVDTGPVLSYDDPVHAVSKRVKFEGERITAVRLSGETAAREWLQAAWLSGDTNPALRRWLLAPLSAPPGGNAGSDKTVCNCMDVSASRIQAGIEAGQDLAALQQNLGCGTQCGSCVPEIRRMLAKAAQPA